MKYILSFMLLFVTVTSFGQLVDVDKFVKEHGIKTTPMPGLLDEYHYGFEVETFTWFKAKGVATGTVKMDEGYNVLMINIECIPTGDFERSKFKLLYTIKDHEYVLKNDEEKVFYLKGNIVNIDTDEQFEFMYGMSMNETGICSIHVPDLGLHLIGGPFYKFSNYE